MNSVGVDAKPVRHGRWLKYMDGRILMCSVCETTFATNKTGKGTASCPRCEAIMDGEIDA